jgi:hypothetical protein
MEKETTTVLAAHASAFVAIGLDRLSAPGAVARPKIFVKSHGAGPWTSFTAAALSG